MPEMIGVVGGLGPEGTIHYYAKPTERLRAIPAGEERPGLVIHHVWMDRFAGLLRQRADAAILELLGGAFTRLHLAGASVGIIAASV